MKSPIFIFFFKSWVTILVNAWKDKSVEERIFKTLIKLSTLLHILPSLGVKIIPPYTVDMLWRTD